ALGVVLGTDGDEQYAPPTGHSGVPGGGLLPPRDGDRPRIVLSASRPPAFADAVADAVGGDLVPLGSAGAKTAAVVRGEADAYIHAGGQYQWDSAAPAGVALARGFVALRVNGDPLRYNVGEVYLPDLVVCRACIADAVLGAIASVAGPAAQALRGPGAPGPRRAALLAGHESAADRQHEHVLGQGH